MNWMVIVLAMMLSGSGNDLVSYVPTGAYWASQHMPAVKADALIAVIGDAKPVKVDVSALIKDLSASSAKVREAAREKLAQAGPAAVPQLTEALKSDDPEVASTAKELVDKATPKGQEAAIRRLMAIRTLGEMKSKEAIPALTKLEASKVPFEADYARAALAAIDGKKYAWPLPDNKQMAADLALLPEEVGAVAQIRALEGEPLKLADMVKLIAATDNKATADTEAKLNESLLQGVTMLGNLRLTGATIAVTQDIGSHGGFIMVILRGQYDPQAIKDFMVKQGRMVEKEVDGVVTVQAGPGDRVAFILPSSEMAVLLTGPGQQQLPLEATVAAIKSGKGKFADNKAMAALLKTVDTTSPAWAACVVGDNYKKAPVLEGADTIVASMKVKEGKVEATCIAKGSDQVKVDKAVKDFNNGLQDAQRWMAKYAKYYEPMKPLIDVVQSVQVTQDKTAVTVKATFMGPWRDLPRLPMLLQMGAMAYFQKGGYQAEMQQQMPR